MGIGAYGGDLLVAEELFLLLRRDDGSVGHPLLDAALERLRAKDGKNISSLVTDGKIAPRRRVADSLAAAAGSS